MPRAASLLLVLLAFAFAAARPAGPPAFSKHVAVANRSPDAVYEAAVTWAEGLEAKQVETQPDTRTVAVRLRQELPIGICGNSPDWALTLTVHAEDSGFRFEASDLRIVREVTLQPADRELTPGEFTYAWDELRTWLDALQQHMADA